MQALLEHFILQSAMYSLIAVALVAFLESLALVGLILPGTVMMAGLGALIGGGELNFWHAWLAGIVGCLLGDWISFWLGWRFKKPLHRWSFVKKHKALLDKTEHALHQHSMFTILVGRFVGPTRPLVPMVAGMLDLPIGKFLTPNLIGCVLWPPLYLLPGILAGAAIDIPAGMQSGSFRWLLLAAALLLWLGGWLGWRLWRSGKGGGGSLNPVFVAGTPALAGSAGSRCWDRGAGGADSPSVDANVYRYSAKGGGLSGGLRGCSDLLRLLAWRRDA
jgi:membrane protein DedA with SNARE-associated domain